MTLSGDIDFKINLDYIELKIDYEKTFEKVNSLKTVFNENLIKDYFGKEKKYIYPYMSINEKKLKEKIDEYANYVNREAKEAEIVLDDKKVSEINEAKVGYKINTENVYKKVIDEINKELFKDFIFNMNDSKDLKIIENKNESISDLEKYRYLISFYNTKVSNDKNIHLIKKIINKLNMTLIKEYKKGSNDKFSFHQIIDNEDLFFRTENDEFSQIASTLNGAVLLADFKNKIVKSNNKYYKDYIEPGIDVKFDIDNDYLIENLESNNYLIITDLKDNTIEISILSSHKKDYSTNLEIEKKDIVKRQYVYLEDKSLSFGEEILKSKGKDGLKAIVNLARYRNGVKKKEQLFTNIYTPLEEIIHISQKKVLK
jgi:vancomycin resistance protein YoaR